MRLMRRQKRLFLALAIFAGAWCLYALWIKPTSARLDTLQRVIPEKTVVLEQLQSKSRRLLNLQDSLNRIQQRLADQPDDFDLLSFLEILTEKCRLSDHLQNMTRQIQPLDQSYSETLVTIELREITLGQLLDFLDRVPSAQILARVKSLNFENNPSHPNRLDATIVVSHLKLTAQAP